jgi:NADPH2:quinone reductase
MSRPPLNREIGDELNRMIAEGIVRPIVGARFPLAQGADAMKLIDERKATGKVVLEA